MAKTPSTMLTLGTPAPAFSLPDTDGKIVSIDSFKGKAGLLVMFICNHCPYVKHIRSELATLTKGFASEVGIVGINSNDIENYPEDGPEKMAQEKKSAGYVFPYLLDETQEVAKAYQAACTPDFFLFDRNLKLVYRGQFDDSRPGTGAPVTGKDLRAALSALVAGQPIPVENQQPSLGCNIKWKTGNEPLYYR